MQINGHLSETFQIKRGVKQGDALSCALFIIAIDPLIRNIDNNPLISPLPFCEGCTVKTMAYADDIAVIATNTNESASALFSEYNILTRCSGLKLNADKTEILNLSEIGKRSTEVMYDNQALEIKHCESTTVCGNFLSLDENKMYEKNILDKITKLDKQLNRWKGRGLTLNGKMIVIKTFAISQLIFSSQFQIIRPKDIRKIEHLCYSFAWNGRDRVRCSVVKSERSDGGINGIDVESFFRSIAVRQFFKSDSDPRLVIINKDPSLKEDIKVLARETIRNILIKQLNADNLNDEWVLRTPASLFVKTYSKAHLLLEDVGITTISSINFSNTSRVMANKIRRCLAPNILLVIDRRQQIDQLNPQVCMSYDNKLYEFSKLTSRTLNFIMKDNKNKIEVCKVGDRFKIDNVLFGDIRNTWNSLWLIKNPTLRAIRHKVLYNDVWTNEKHFKFKLMQDDKCTICGETETVFHQLFLCKNAVRFWTIFSEITGKEIPTNVGHFARTISVTNDYLIEVLKACILKLLIQVDRSKDMTLVQIRRYLLYWVKIEHSSITSKLKRNKSQIQRLTQVISYLSKET